MPEQVTPHMSTPSGEKRPPLVAELWAVHDLMDDRGMCPYYRRGEPGQDPEGICSFGCRDEPSCQTDHGGPEYPWASEALRDLIARVEQVGWMSDLRRIGGRVTFYPCEEAVDRWCVEHPTNVAVYTAATGKGDE